MAVLTTLDVPGGTRGGLAGKLALAGLLSGLELR